MARTIFSQTLPSLEKRKRNLLHSSGFGLKVNKNGIIFHKNVIYKNVCFHSNLLRTVTVNKDIMIVQINCFVQLFLLPLGLTLRFFSLENAVIALKIPYSVNQTHSSAGACRMSIIITYLLSWWVYLALALLSEAGGLHVSH